MRQTFQTTEALINQTTSKTLSINKDNRQNMCQIAPMIEGFPPDC